MRACRINTHAILSHFVRHAKVMGHAGKRPHTPHFRGWCGVKRNPIQQHHVGIGAPARARLSGTAPFSGRDSGFDDLWVGLQRRRRKRERTGSRKLNAHTNRTRGDIILHNLCCVRMPIHKHTRLAGDRQAVKYCAYTCFYGRDRKRARRRRVAVTDICMNRFSVGEVLAVRAYVSARWRESDT